jgi:hypothetical protein
VVGTAVVPGAVVGVVGGTARVVVGTVVVVVGAVVVVVGGAAVEVVAVVVEGVVVEAVVVEGVVVEAVVVEGVVVDVSSVVVATVATGRDSAPVVAVRTGVADMVRTGTVVPTAVAGEPFGRTFAAASGANALSPLVPKADFDGARPLDGPVLR